MAPSGGPNYLNALQPDNDRNDGMQRFHSWLQSAPPSGPKIITKLYNLRDSDASHAYCHGCATTVQLECLSPTCTAGVYPLTRRSQKGVDVGLATLALTHLDSYDTLMLSSGDGDLLDAIKFVSDAGKEIELAVFRAGVATELQSWADRIYWIDEFAQRNSAELTLRKGISSMSFLQKGEKAPGFRINRTQFKPCPTLRTLGFR